MKVLIKLFFLSAVILVGVFFVISIMVMADGKPDTSAPRKQFGDDFNNLMRQMDEGLTAEERKRENKIRKQQEEESPKEREARLKKIREDAILANEQRIRDEHAAAEQKYEEDKKRRQVSLYEEKRSLELNVI
jgi:hypothetical protein